MSFIDRITIDRFDLRPKLILAFVLVATLVLVTGAIGYVSVGTVDGQLHSVVEDDVAEADAAMEMRYDLESERRSLLAVVTGHEGAVEEYHSAAADFETQYTTLAERDDLTDEQRDRLSEIETAHAEASQTAEAAISAMEAGDEQLARERVDEIDGVYEDLEADTVAFEEDANEKMAASVTAADRMTNQSHLLIVVMTIGAFLAAIAIGLFVARRITKPVKQLEAASIAMSEGDLSVSVDEHVEDDELGRMTVAFTEMQVNLRAVFDEIDTFGTNLASGDDDLQERERRTDFPGTYGEIMTNLDRGATEMVGGFEEIRSASQDLQAGRLDQKIDTDRPGQYGAILTSFDDGMQTLSGSFDEISTASEGLKDGDLDQRLDTDAPGAYGQTLADLEAGVQQLGDSIESVQSIATEVAASSEEVTASAEEIEAASEEVATSVEEISHGAETQTENLQEVAGEMNDMSATVEEIASSSEEVAATATSAVERGETGREHASEASTEIEAIESTADEATDQVQQLDDKMEEIGEIVEMITGIAEQTNMLALNASIEAARAGEAGEGFGVVANEIKSLAEDAGQATTKIEARIEEVQATTDETVSEMEEMRERVASGSETIEDAIAMFDDIADSIQEAEDGIREISEATDDQAASTEEVVSMVDQVSSVSQQTSAEASNVSAATEEQSSSLSEATQTLQDLSMLADDLHDEVSDFDVETDGSQRPATRTRGSIGATDRSGVDTSSTRTESTSERAVMTNDGRLETEDDGSPKTVEWSDSAGAALDDEADQTEGDD
ncbi:HAMP domain-containing methyl-accepting chemotaxis protein [Halococcoides cellulosivorans]|uniref:Chemotaxis protein n=1 Tax=Halococcoides cellulosivorans TaxID=1679096 RepID=A0A2R4WXT2_9EURY|nr:methyl-accepting chemotaxis protein [Halococcoides cellulosivorans]AWB26321.1 chemotaxis protein [Halococcoides cellulosivorans]